VIRANRAFLGPKAGDKDAPIITLMNIPKVGGPHGAWDLIKGSEGYDSLLNGLKEATRSIATVSDYFCIACNTLHKNQSEIEKFLAEEKIDCKFVSIVDSVSQHCEKNKITSLVVMGSKMTTDVKETSPYAPLSESVELPVLSEELRDRQQKALEMIKAKGAENKEVQEYFQATLDSFDATNVLLGCTEFPLMKVKTEKVLIDPTQLLADRLLALSWGYSDGNLPENC